MRTLPRRVCLASFPMVVVGLALAACSGPGATAEPTAPTAPKLPDAPTAAPPATAVAPPTAAPTASAEATAPPPKAPSECRAGMVLVNGGTYTMGPPKREVTVGSICMDLNETTADEFTACVKAGKCAADNLKCAPQATYQASGKGNHPINCVDFAQATAYCASQSKRLPTDAEWEWAARGGGEGRIYPWGNDKPGAQACWSGKEARVGTCAVGGMSGGDNPQGIHDLSGNVFEWVTTKQDSAGADRVGRGGSWKDGAPELLKVNRPAAFKVTYRCGFLGIRCVTDAQAATK